MDTANFKKRCILIFLLTLCVLLCGCHGNIIGNLMTSEHTELLVDGEYRPFEDPKKNLEKLMELVEAEDWPQNVTSEPNPMETLIQLAAEENPKRIYEMFSLTAKRSAEGLQEKATELSSFLSEQVISWESYTWAQNAEDFNQSTAITRKMFFYLYTDNGLYRCDIREVLESTNQADVGVTSISIFPALYPGERPPFEAEVYRGYCTWGCENTGISIFQ